VLESVRFCGSLIQEIEYGSDFPAIAISFCLAGRTQINVNCLEAAFDLGYGQGILALLGLRCKLHSSIRLTKAGFTWIIC
jgi:hypothetical protein